MTRSGQEPDEGDFGQIDWRDCPHVERNPKIMSGAWCFEGTRLPVYLLFGNLADGMSIPEFMEHYPGAKADHISAVLEFLARRLDEDEDEDEQERCTVVAVPLKTAQRRR